MPKISDKKKDKISEHILSLLYSSYPKPLFTANISQEVARDEEFIKSLLEKLEKKELLVKVIKNPKGVNYTRRVRWRLSNKAYDAYKKL
ncbi:MAG: hypothetical protein QXI33_00430 [Candidatus Pacearchaeota archaeon]